MEKKYKFGKIEDKLLGILRRGEFEKAREAKAGANVNATDEYGESMLEYALTEFSKNRAETTGFFIDAGFEYNDVTRLIVTQDMSERKAKMIELGDAFIAFPGGTGTLEEITEVMSKVSLRHLSAPCILYNLNGYYNDLKALLRHMIEAGLSSAEKQQGIYFAESLDGIRAILKQ